MSLSMAMLFYSVAARGIMNPVAGAAPAGGDSPLYFTLLNSSETFNLVAVTCTCAERVELVDEHGQDSGALPLAIPHPRLVEFRPGASRHFVLRGLRRPLVAGQTVTMTFRYSDYSDEADVRIVFQPEVAWPTQSPEAGRRLPPPMQALAGWCWRGTAPMGRHTHTRCFSPVYGREMQDWHVVEGRPGAPDYRLYSADYMSGSVHFSFIGPNGAWRHGSVLPDGADVAFLEYPEGPAGRAEDGVRTNWHRAGPEAWDVATQTWREGRWQDVSRLHMVRAGRAPAL